MSLLLYGCIALFLWYEYRLVLQAIGCLLFACLTFLMALVMLVITLIDLAMVVIVPVALFMGYNAEDWSLTVSTKVLDWGAKVARGRRHGSS